MDAWYYGKDGRQGGPVTWDALRGLAASGQLAPGDLVWTSSMKDWKPAAEIPGLSSTPPSPISGAEASSPYAAPPSTWNPAPAVAPIEGEPLPEVAPGSVQIGVGECISRASTLVLRHFGTILLVGVVYVALTFAVGFALGLVDTALGLKPVNTMVHFDPTHMRVGPTGTQAEEEPSNEFPTTHRTRVSTFNRSSDGGLLSQIGGQILSVFLSLGCARIGLNLVDGKEADVGMMFGEGRKLLRAIGASILYLLMVGLGLICLLVPGIYLAMRFGLYRKAIVDRDLGIMDAFRYSSDLTTNNRMNLFGLAVLCFLITIAGAIALCVGLLYAVPLVWLAELVAYRWLQRGPQVLQDRLRFPWR
ncbi:GYF domain-containing protein [Luteolibacter sp. LG18]|uniref:GYF domain-containing protein n=1 Tax=Luteolibacter sp. LG18 TaxID=2819286 RepID=UPI002B2CFEB7|nr:hypothetical protein llg_13190 [Luteolibacter sp. LG18]